MLPRHRLREGMPLDELIRVLRLEQDDRARSVAHVEEMLPGSKHDEITFKSGGDGVEVKVPHKFKRPPNRMEVVDIEHPYTAGRSREKLSDESTIYVKTSAPKGTAVVARFYRV